MRIFSLAVLVAGCSGIAAADKPPLDTKQPSKIETATFAMG